MPGEKLDATASQSTSQRSLPKHSYRLSTVYNALQTLLDLLLFHPPREVCGAGRSTRGVTDGERAQDSGVRSPSAHSTLRPSTGTKEHYTRILNVTPSTSLQPKERRVLAAPSTPQPGGPGPFTPKESQTPQGPERPTLAPVTSLAARPCPSLCAGHADVLAVLVPAGPFPP